MHGVTALELQAVCTGQTDPTPALCVWGMLLTWPQPQSPYLQHSRDACKTSAT